MQIVKKNINDLIFPDYNPRKKLTPEDKEYQKIKNSIQEYGYADLVIINKDNTIIGGNQRSQVLKDLGYEEIECVQLDLDKTKEKALNIALNKITGEWDYGKLGDLLLELDSENFDLELTGFEDFEIEGIMAPIDFGEEKEIIEDEAPEVPEEPKAKLGDIYQLGNHRLMCGDSTKEEDVAKLMNGVKTQMTFSDAPYNISFKGSMSNTTINGVMVKHKGANQRHDAIDNDCMSKEEFYDFMCKTLQNIKEYVKGAWYLSFSSNNLEELLNPLRDNDMNWKSIIIWMKNQATLSMKDYKSRYEPIVYGRFDDTFYGQTAKEEDIWEYQRTLKNDLHPTMKPIPLICNMLKMSSKENDNVLDLFGGSGSTLIACEQLNRKCYMMELDPHYIDVIIQRWENFTGEKAVLLNREEKE